MDEQPTPPTAGIESIKMFQTQQQQPRVNYDTHISNKNKKKRKSQCKPAFKLQVNASKSCELIVSSPLFEFFCLTKSPTWSDGRYGTNSNGLEMSELKVNSTYGLLSRFVLLFAVVVVYFLFLLKLINITVRIINFRIFEI